MVFLSAVPVLLVVLLELVTLAGPRPPRPEAAPLPGEARATSLALAASTGAGEGAVAGPGDRDRGVVEGVLTSAEALRGAPYLYGGQAPGTGFDCSGFVGYVYRLHGISLPRTSRAQARVGEAVPSDPESFRPGDLLFFATSGGSVDHVALYTGDDRILHASETGGTVREDRLDGPSGGWLLERLVGVRRVVR